MTRNPVWGPGRGRSCGRRSVRFPPGPQAAVSPGPEYCSTRPRVLHTENSVTASSHKAPLGRGSAGFVRLLAAPSPRPCSKILRKSICFLHIVLTVPIPKCSCPRLRLRPGAAGTPPAMRFCSSVSYKLFKVSQAKMSRSLLTNSISPLSPVPSDIEISQSITPFHISEVAKAAGILESEFEPYGRYKGKVLNVCDGHILIRLVLTYTPEYAGKPQCTGQIGRQC